MTTPPDFRPDIYADGVVNSLQSSLGHGTENLATIPGLLKTVIVKELWRHRYVTRLKEEVSFDSFVEFVHAPALKGLGTDVATLRKFCQSADDLEAVDLIVAASKGKPGPKPRSVNNVNGTKRPMGNAAARALVDLKSKRKDLHSRVLAGELSPHAAMIEAGFRKRWYQVPPDPVAAAAALRRHFSPEELQEIVSLLTAGEE